MRKDKSFQSVCVANYNLYRINFNYRSCKNARTNSSKYEKIHLEEQVLLISHRQQSANGLEMYVPNDRRKMDKATQVGTMNS